MVYLYMGFDQGTHFREYYFDGLVSKGVKKRFIVTADVELFTKYRVRIQDGPALCLRLLEACGEAEPMPETRLLSEAELVSHVRNRAAEAEAAQLKKARRQVRSFRPTPAPVV
jgi:hypothetical protein